MRRATHWLVVIVAMLSAAPAVAQEPEELDSVPTLARLREILRQALDTDGWHDVGSASCHVERRARAAGVEVAILRRTASRLSIDEELLVAVRGPEGWRVVTTLEPEVQNGHGWRGAIEVVSLEVSAGTITVRSRSWVREVENGSYDVTAPWVLLRTACVREEDAWSCASA